MKNDDNQLVSTAKGDSRVRVQCPLHLRWNFVLGSFLSLQILVAVALPAFGQPYYVAPAGNDANPGTIGRPFASLQRAQAALRQKRGTVYLRGGTYYLPETLVLTAQDSGAKDAPVVFQPYQNEHAVLSGGVKLEN